MQDYKDYAYPLMTAEKALKEVYDLMLHGKPEEAMEKAFKAQEAVIEAMLEIRPYLK